MPKITEQRIALAAKLGPLTEVLNGDYDGERMRFDLFAIKVSGRGVRRNPNPGWPTKTLPSPAECSAAAERLRNTVTDWVERWIRLGRPPRLDVYVMRHPEVRRVVDRLTKELTTAGIMRLFLSSEDEPDFDDADTATTLALSGGEYHVIRDPLAFKSQPDLDLLVDAEAFRLFRILLDSNVSDLLGRCSRCKRYYLNLGGLKTRTYCDRRTCGQKVAATNFYMRHGDVIRKKMRAEMAARRAQQKRSQKRKGRHAR